MQDKSLSIIKVLVRLIEVHLPTDGTDLLKRKNWDTEGTNISNVLMIKSNWISWNAVWSESFMYGVNGGKRER